MVVPVTMTLTARQAEATSLGLGASVTENPETVSRPFGTEGYLDHIQKPAFCW